VADFAALIRPGKVARVHGVVSVVVVASLAYVGAMVDNFFALAAQLVVTERARHRRVAWAQSMAVLALLVIAGGVAEALAPVPLRVVGLAALAPFALALRAWRHRGDERHPQFRRGAVATFLVTVSLGGDNVAVWAPLLRAAGTWRGLGTVAVFALWQVVFVLAVEALADHPRVVAWGERRGPLLVPWVYLGLGALILVECRTFA